MEKTMVIIGAGIAGLSTGCYARMNGYETNIYEMDRIPGGLCTAWKRKGYTFDISMHMLTGSRGGPVHRMWHELGVLRDRTFFYHDILSRIESRGKNLTICTDPRRLEEQMTALSPADTKLTKEFVRLFTGRDMMGAMSLKPAELTGFFDKLKMIAAILPLMQAMLRSLPGLSGFYMVGQWTIPFSGTVMAALSGRQLIQLLCKWSGKPFMTSIP